MEPEVVLDDEYATLWYHPLEKVVHHKIYKFLIPGVLEKLLGAGAELMEQHGAAKWLSDDRNNVVISPEDLKWADEHWLPRVQRAGFRYWAIVAPGNAVASMQMKALQARRQRQKIEVSLFESPEDAMAWLASR